MRVLLPHSLHLGPDTSEKGFSGGSEVKNPPAVHEPQETRVQPLGWDDPLEEGMATHSSILAWRIPMGRGAWQVIVHGVEKSGARLNHSVHRK